MMSPTLVGLHIAKVEVRGVTLVFTMETLVLRMRRAAAEPWLHITLYRAWWTGVVLTVLAVFVRYHTVDARCLATSNMRGTAELDFFVMYTENYKKNVFWPTDVNNGNTVPMALFSICLLTDNALLVFFSFVDPLDTSYIVIIYTVLGFINCAQLIRY